MPQLVPADWVPQLVWLAITFAALYLIMARVALPRISNVLEQRQNRIADDLDQAETSRGEAQAAEEAYENSLADARARAHTIVVETRGKIRAELGKRREALDAALAEETRAAERRIAAAKEDALDGVRDIASSTAQLIVARLLGVELEDGRVRQAVAEALGGPGTEAG